MRRLTIKSPQTAPKKAIEGVEFASGKVAIDHPDRGVLVYESVDQLRTLSWMPGCTIEYLDQSK
jgi:hypothetical protein